jgi:hypothetical protein
MAGGHDGKPLDFGEFVGHGLATSGVCGRGKVSGEVAALTRMRETA